MTKPLRAQLRDVDADIKIYRDAVKMLTAKRDDLLVQIRNEERRPSISDHAVLRYFSRKHGVDFEALKEEMLQGLESAIRAGATSVTHDGMEFRIENQVVVTVVPAK